MPEQGRDECVAPKYRDKVSRSVANYGPGSRSRLATCRNSRSLIGWIVRYLPARKPKPTHETNPYIDNPEDLARLAQALASQDLIAFDTEFLWERTYSPRLGLIQVADSASTWIIDPLAIPPKEMEPLVEVLVSPDTLKVAHAVDQDQICMVRNYGRVAEPVLDTAVAAALTGMGEQIGLSTLLSKLLRIEIQKGYSRTNWLKRPLPTEMSKYAMEDVAHLPRAADLLLKKLRKLGREDWAMEISAKAGELASKQVDPASLARKLSEGRRLESTAYYVLKELIAWREEEASRLDIPRRWLAEDKVLVKLAIARPSKPNQLADFRGLAISNRPKSAQRVLRAVQAGLSSRSDGYQRPQRLRSATPQESAAQVVLRCFLNALAADHLIPPKLLADDSRMLALIRGRFESVESLRESGVLDQRVVDLIGKELVAILNGRRGLCLMDGAATQIDVSGIRIDEVSAREPASEAPL